MIRRGERTIQRVGSSSGALLLALTFSSMVPAADFLRGDANNDGVVSLADAYTIFKFLFGHGELTCGTAADANDSGEVDFNDGDYILVYMLGDLPPPPPFPSAGPDPTPDGTHFPFGCDSYGGSSVVDDPSSRIEISDAVADGGKDGSAYIVIALSNRSHTMAFGGALRFPPGLITSVGKGGKNDLIPGAYFSTRLVDDRLSFIVEGGL